MLHAGPAVRQLATAPCLDLGLTKAAAETQRQPYSTVMQAATGVFVAAHVDQIRGSSPGGREAAGSIAAISSLAT